MTRSTPENTEAEVLDAGLLGLLRLLFRGRVVLIGAALTFGILGFVVAKVTHTWSAEVTVRPQTSNASMSRVSGLAAQFGLTLPGAPVGDPVRFYAELLQSREVLTQAVQTRYTIARKWGSSDSLHGSFLELYKVKGVDSTDRVGRGRDRLKALMTVTTDREAGFVRMKLVTKWPDLSLDLAKAILALTNSASIGKQQYQAEAERSFAERRLKDADSALAAAEGDLEQFLAGNRQYRNSPLLTLEFERLQRRVDLRQQVALTLAQAYEQARIDEVRDTPVLMIVDGVDGSVRVGRRAGRDAVLWAMVGFGLAVLLVLGLDGVERFKRQHPGELDPFLAEVSRSWPFRWLSGRGA
jgi:uncharacterized protein involved in exopolysaccharide biosynthesis